MIRCAQNYEYTHCKWEREITKNVFEENEREIGEEENESWRVCVGKRKDKFLFVE